MSHKACIILRGKKSPSVSLQDRVPFERRTTWHLCLMLPGSPECVGGTSEAGIKCMVRLWASARALGRMGFAISPTPTYLCFCIHIRSHTYIMAWAAGQAKCIDCRRAEWHLGALFGWTVLICSVLTNKELNFVWVEK